MARANSIDLGLSATPEINDPILFREFLRVYNALNILAQSVGVAVPGNFTSITNTGLLDISAATAGQIKFPAAQNASANVNTLDDYEEGTFTPTISFGGASVGVTYTTQSGVYTKIGNIVIYSLNIALSSKGSSVGSLLVGGLPFNSNAVAGNKAPAAVYGIAITTTGQLGVFVNNGAATITVGQVTPGGVSTAIADTALTNLSSIQIAGHYIV